MVWSAFLLDSKTGPHCGSGTTNSHVNVYRIYIFLPFLCTSFWS